MSNDYDKYYKLKKNGINSYKKNISAWSSRSLTGCEAMAMTMSSTVVTHISQTVLAHTQTFW